MIDQNLINYIKQRVSQGASSEQISSELTSAGWDYAKVQEALKFVLSSDSTISAVNNSYSDKGVETNINKNLDPASKQNTFIPENAQAQVSVTGLLSISDLINDSFKLFMHSWKKIILLLIAGNVVSLIIVVLSMLILAGSFIGTMQSYDPTYIFSGMFIVYVPIGLILVTISIWMFFSIIKVLDQPKVSISEALSHTKGKVLSGVLVMFILGFIISGGIVLFILPAYYLLIVFSLVAFVIVDENLSGYSALFRSKQLVSGHFWGVLGRFLLMVILVSVVVYPVNMALSEISQVLALVVTTIIQILSGPFMYAVMFTIYKNLKQIEESKGEVAKVESGFKIFTYIVTALGVLLTTVVVFAILFFGSAFFEGISQATDELNDSTTTPYLNDGSGNIEDAEFSEYYNVDQEDLDQYYNLLENALENSEVN